MSTIWTYVTVAVVVVCANPADAAVGDCVCDNGADPCGVVTVESANGVVVFDGTDRTFIAAADVTSAAETVCNPAYGHNQCACTVADAPVYQLISSGLNQIDTASSGSCYVLHLGLRLAGPNHNLPGVPLLELVRYDEGPPLELRFISRTDLTLDPTLAGCRDPGFCEPDVVPDSELCTAVFVQNIPAEDISTAQFGETCVYGIDQRVTYQDARDFCETNGLRLVWVRDDQIAQNIYDGIGFTQYWIGLEKIDGQWMWVSPQGNEDATADIAGRLIEDSSSESESESDEDEETVACLDTVFPGSGSGSSESTEAPPTEGPTFTLRAKNGNQRRRFVCEETIACSGYRATIAMYLTMMTIAVTLTIST